MVLNSVPRFLTHDVLLTSREVLHQFQDTWVLLTANLCRSRAISDNIFHLYCCGVAMAHRGCQEERLSEFYWFFSADTLSPSSGE